MSTPAEEMRPQTLGAMIDELYELREKKAALEKQAKAIADDMTIVEGRILSNLDSQDMTMGKGRSASAVLSETVIPKVDDWGDYYEYIKSQDALHLLQRRPATTALREMMEAGEEIPGVSTFTKRSISLRKV